MKPGSFVFAVCGGREHLARAGEAAARLRRFTARPILVATDPARNRATLDGVEVLAIPTDPRWSDAQAAILLKSALAEHLPGDAVHCYLDSDVVAIGGEVDRIFEHFQPPLTFASDLPVPEATLRTFGGHGFACECALERSRLERFCRRLERLTALHREHRELAALGDPELYRNPRFEGERRRGAWWNGTATGAAADGSVRFEQTFRAGQPVRLVHHFHNGRFVRIEEEGGARFEDGEGPALAWIEDRSCVGGGFWRDADGDSLRRIADSGDGVLWWYRDDRPRRRWRSDSERDAGGAWVDGAGDELGVCDHLAEALERRFAISIADRTWVPWNGGVFLFGPGARPLLADWRRRCEELFATPGFAVRDQAALVATAWAHGLDRHPRLPAAFNRIVDRRSRAGASVRLRDLEAEGAQLLHLIGGGLGDLSWPLGRDLAP